MSFTRKRRNSLSTTRPASWSGTPIVRNGNPSVVGRPIFSAGVMGSAGRRGLLFLLWAVPVLYLLGSLFMILWVTRHSYPALLDWYAAGWPNAYDVETLARRCFTKSWYDGIGSHAAVLTGVIAGALLIYLYRVGAVWKFLGGFLDEIMKAGRFVTATFRGCTSKQRYALLLLFGAILAYRIYFYIAITPHTDEVCSYLFFIRQGWFISAVNYPTTNNHILFSLVCSLLNKLPFAGPLAVMRWPNMIGDLVLFGGIFCLVKYWGGFQRAMVVVAGVAFCHLISYYAVLGRGYQWQELCAVISGLGGWAYFSPGRWSGRRGYALFILASVAGMYVNPLFVYHLLALALLFFYFLVVRKEYAKLAVLAMGFLTIGALVAMLYLPLVLGSGWGALTQNEFVKGWASWRDLASHFYAVTYDLKFDFYYGTPGMYLFFGCVLLSAYLYYRHKIGGEFYYFAACYFWAILLSVAILVLFKRVYPEDRSLCFWVLGVNIIFVNVCYDAIRQFSARWSTALIMLFVSLKIAGSVRGLCWENFSIDNTVQVREYRIIRKDLEELDRLAPTNWQFHDSHDFYPLFGRWYLAGKGEEGRIRVSSGEAVGGVIFMPDSCSGQIFLGGYSKLAGKRITTYGGGLTIYISPALLRNNRPGF